MKNITKLSRINSIYKRELPVPVIKHIVNKIEIGRNPAVVWAISRGYRPHTMTDPVTKNQDSYIMTKHGLVSVWELYRKRNLNYRRRN